MSSEATKGLGPLGLVPLHTPTFAVFPPGTGVWVLAHPRNDPRSFVLVAPRRSYFPLTRGNCSPYLNIEGRSIERGDEGTRRPTLILRVDALGEATKGLVALPSYRGTALPCGVALLELFNASQV